MYFISSIPCRARLHSVGLRSCCGSARSFQVHFNFCIKIFNRVICQYQWKKTLNRPFELRLNYQLGYYLLPYNTFFIISFQSISDCLSLSLHSAIFLYRIDITLQPSCNCFTFINLRVIPPAWLIINICRLHHWSILSL